MPATRTSKDLCDNYDEISRLCHSCSEPVFITDNGRDDLVVISIELYEQLNGKFELYSLLQKGLDDERAGRIRPLSEALTNLTDKK